MDKKNFDVWKRVTLGTCGSADELLNSVANLGFKIGYGKSDPTKVAVRNMTLSQTETRIDLFREPISAFGFCVDTPYDKVWEEVKVSGFKLVPDETVFQIARQHPNTPMDEWSLMAMEPIMLVDYNSSLFAFAMVHGPVNGKVIWADHCTSGGIPCCIRSHQHIVFTRN